MNSINLLFLLSIAITLYMSTQILAEDLVVTEATEEDNVDVGARVFLHKFSDTNPTVEGKDFVITYQLINSGSVTATNIEIKDRYDPNSFETVTNVDSEGFVNFSLEELGPGSQSQFNVTVRPKLSGTYESTRARIQYTSGSAHIEEVDSESEGQDVRQGYSTSLGRTRIISQLEFSRNDQYFMRQWAIFFAIYAVPTLLPFFLWKKAKNTTARSDTVSHNKKRQ